VRLRTVDSVLGPIRSRGCGADLRLDHRRSGRWVRSEAIALIYAAPRRSPRRKPVPIGCRTGGAHDGARSENRVGSVARASTECAPAHLSVA
jgi:hypothetical protein